MSGLCGESSPVAAWSMTDGHPTLCVLPRDHDRRHDPRRGAPWHRSGRVRWAGNLIETVPPWWVRALRRRLIVTGDRARVEASRLVWGRDIVWGQPLDGEQVFYLTLLSLIHTVTGRGVTLYRTRSGWQIGWDR